MSRSSLPMEKIERQYDLVGKNYLHSQQRIYANSRDPATRFIRNHLPDLRNNKLLDIGCGSGTDIAYYEQQGSIAYGIDASGFMVTTAKNKMKHSDRVSRQRIEHTSFPSSHFDIITGRYCLHYLRSIDAGYNEMARLLKRNGLLILVVDHPLDALMKKKNKIYGKRETISFKLTGSDIIRFPSHTLAEYFSKTFLVAFSLEAYEEGIDDFHKTTNSVPNYLAIEARRR